MGGWKGVHGSKTRVTDPLYGQSFEFAIHDIQTESGPLRFAAGEFSNGVYGFYVPDHR